MCTPGTACSFLLRMDTELVPQSPPGLQFPSETGQSRRPCPDPFTASPPPARFRHNQGPRPLRQLFFLSESPVGITGQEKKEGEKIPGIKGSFTPCR